MGQSTRQGEGIQAQTPDLRIHEPLMKGFQIVEERRLPGPHVHNEGIQINEILVLSKLRHGLAHFVQNEFPFAQPPRHRV